MDDAGKTATKKRKHSFSVRAMSSVIPQQMRRKLNVLPCVSSFPATCRRGYLWRLSGKRVLATTGWKTKYFVLHEDKLYYYASMKGQAGGVIELKNFVDCVEAPLSDHKKANNVFFLVAEERGFFDQGRYYLSAETLSEMKGWVTGIRLVLEKIKQQNIKETLNESRESNSLLYSSIQEDSIQRSNSVTTLHSNNQDHIGLKHLNMTAWQNRSMDCGPLLGLGEDDHDLTYSYSSEEEGLNTSLPNNFVQKSPRSAETSLRRQAMQRGAQFKSLDERSTFDTHREQTYLSFEDLLYTDANNYGSAVRSTQNTLGHLDDISGSSTEYRKLANMVHDVKTQSDNLSQVFRTLENECGHNRRDVGSMYNTFPSSESRVDKLGDRLELLQSVMARLETQATDMMLEIRATHYHAMQCVSEAEKAKREYQDLKEKAESVLFQLQRETAAPKIPFLNNQRTSDPNESQGHNLYSTDWAQTFPKQHKVTPMTPYQPQSILRTNNGSDNSLTRRNRNLQSSVKICQDPSHVNQASAPPETYEVQSLHLQKDNNEDDKMNDIYTKPQYKEHYQIETENRKSLRRRSLINYGYLKHSQEPQNYRKSQLVEEETNENVK